MMMQALQNIDNGHNWVYFTMRWGVLLAFYILIFIGQGRVWTGFASLNDFVMPVAVGIGATLILLPFILIEQIRAYIVYIIIVTDIVIAGVFVSLVDNDFLLIVGIILPIIVMGAMRLGLGFGLAQMVGIIIATVVALATNPTVGTVYLQSAWQTYLPLIIIFALVATVTGIWSYRRDVENTSTSRKIRQQMKRNNDRLASMRDRASTIAELGTRLYATLDSDRILDAMLDIGRLSLRNVGENVRFVSMVLLVSENHTLEIATARGVNYVDENHQFAGQEGILARALDQENALIEHVGEDDPELQRMVAFKNIESTMVIPLRAGYDTYGAIVYGSTDKDAFNEDTLDTIKAIAQQATVSLQNAILFMSLMDEKEKILAIEESARQELVRDLHDVPTQTMSAITMRLGVLPRLMDARPNEVRHEVGEILKMSRRATEEIRHVMFSLRPLSLETQGLETALKQLAEKTINTYKQNVTVQVASFAEMLLEKKQQGAIFFLVEEAVNNARKYAQAPLIKITVSIEKNHVVTRVMDQGKGFDTSLVTDNYENRGSFGMVNMRERAELVGGTFKIASQPGKGTVVTVRVKVDTSQIADLKKSPANNVDASTALRSRPSNKKKSSRKYSGPMSPST